MIICRGLNNLEPKNLYSFDFVKSTLQLLEAHAKIHITKLYIIHIQILHRHIRRQ